MVHKYIMEFTETNWPRGDSMNDALKEFKRKLMGWNRDGWECK